MHRDNADFLMQKCLFKHQFDFENPSLLDAWVAFTEFVRLPLEGLVTETVGVEIEQYDDRDDVLWVSMMRRFDALDGTGWSCGCLLSRASPPDLAGVRQGRWCWTEHETLEKWVSEVEQMPVFTKVIALDGWKWEGFSE